MSARAATPALVSRRAELAALWSAVERAAGGESATVLVSGDAGVGKSRLVSELAARAQDEEMLVLVGRCVDVGDGELPYAPVAGALRSLAAQVAEDDLDEALGSGRAELARLAPDLGEAAGAPSAFGKARLFELLLGALGRLGRQRPVVLVVEDLHWADGSTRDLLRFVVRAAAAERLALIATYRTDDLHRAHALRPYLVELGRDPRVSRVDLQPFTRAEFVDHVAAILGRLPSGAVLDRLYERSEGNAFITEELLAAPDLELPDSLRDAMLVRLERLPGAAQHVVRVLAAAGRRVDHRLLARATGLPESELSDALRAAIEGRVLAPAGDGAAYEFRHALLREAAYAELLPGERRALHLALARELEADPELAGSEATQAAELAHHWHAAGERELALAASLRAGEEAKRVYAHPEALRHLQRALELWEVVDPAAREGVDRIEITESAAQAAADAGEHQLAIALLRRAIELVEPEGAPAVAARLHVLLASCLWNAGRGGDAVVQSRRAAELIPPEPTAERARLLEAHARLLMLNARREEALPALEEAIAIARELGEAGVEAHALATRVIEMEGRPEEWRATGLAALDVARRSGEPEALMRAYLNVSEGLDHAGEAQEAIDLAREGVEASQPLGAERRTGGHLRGEVAHRLAKLGRLDEAAALVEDALRAAPSGTAAVGLHQTAATIAAHRGDAAGTEAAVALTKANAFEGGGGQATARAFAASAELELWRGDPGRAWAIVEEALGLVKDAEFLWYSAPLYALGAWAQADRALAARALGGETEAEAARAAVVALRDRFDALVVGDGAPEPAAYRAQLGAELARLDDAPDAAAWEDARRRWEALNFPFHAAVCAWREAEALLTGDGDRARAAELLDAAGRGAEALGARPLKEQIEALARRARLRPAETRPPLGLTARELEVLELIADGRTNREIGAALFISEKTVSVHVSRVLGKLGAANRAQAATIAHRLGIPAPPK